MDFEEAKLRAALAELGYAPAYIAGWVAEARELWETLQQLQRQFNDFMYYPIKLAAERRQAAPAPQEQEGESLGDTK